MDVPKTPEPEFPPPYAKSSAGMSGCAKGALWSLVVVLGLIALVFIVILAVCSK